MHKILHKTNSFRQQRMETFLDLDTRSCQLNKRWTVSITTERRKSVLQLPMKRPAKTKQDEHILVRENFRLDISFTSYKFHFELEMASFPGNVVAMTTTAVARMPSGINIRRTLTLRSLTAAKSCMSNNTAVVVAVVRRRPIHRCSSHLSARAFRRLIIVGHDLPRRLIGTKFTEVLTTPRRFRLRRAARCQFHSGDSIFILRPRQSACLEYRPTPLRVFSQQLFHAQAAISKIWGSEVRTPKT